MIAYYALAVKLAAPGAPFVEIMRQAIADGVSMEDIRRALGVAMQMVEAQS